MPANSRSDIFQSPDYFQLDELLTEEHKLIRDSVRNYVKKQISPIIEDYAQKAEFPQQIVVSLGNWVFWPYDPGGVWRGRHRLYQLWVDDAGA